MADKGLSPIFRHFEISDRNQKCKCKCVTEILNGLDVIDAVKSSYIYHF